jgi:hypothetical protein
MFSQEDKTEWIDRYLDNLLSEVERIQFEDLLVHDSELKLEVEAQKAVRRTLQMQGDMNLKSKFKQFHSRMEDEEKILLPKSGYQELPKENIQVNKWWMNSGILSIAASLLLVLVASSIIWLNKESLFNSKQVETASSRTFQIPVIERSGMGYAGTSVDSVVVQILSSKQYNNQYRFKDSLQIFMHSINDETPRMQLEYIDSLNAYILIINKQRYPIERGFNKIQELKQE